MSVNLYKSSCRTPSVSTAADTVTTLEKHAVTCNLHIVRRLHLFFFSSNKWHRHCFYRTRYIRHHKPKITVYFRCLLLLKTSEWWCSENPCRGMPEQNEQWALFLLLAEVAEVQWGRHLLIMTCSKVRKKITTYSKKQNTCAKHPGPERWMLQDAVCWARNARGPCSS